MMQAEHQRERRTTVKRLRNSIAHLIAPLEKKLPELDRDIDDTVRGSPLRREKEDLLASVPAVGLKPSILSSPICRNLAA
jgi:transposase